METAKTTQAAADKTVANRNIRLVQVAIFLTATIVVALILLIANQLASTQDIDVNDEPQVTTTVTPTVEVISSPTTVPSTTTPTKDHQTKTTTEQFRIQFDGPAFAGLGADLKIEMPHGFSVDRINSEKVILTDGSTSLELFIMYTSELESVTNLTKVGKSASFGDIYRAMSSQGQKYVNWEVQEDGQCQYIDAYIDAPCAHGLLVTEEAIIGAECKAGDVMTCDQLMLAVEILN